MTNEQLLQSAFDEGFQSAVIIDTADITFESAFRHYCKDNYCGQYDANYSCPPICGSPEAMQQKITAHKKALVVQTFWDIPDYHDKAAVKKAKDSHNGALIRLTQKARTEGCAGFMIGASGCSLCSPCKMTKGEPCSFPDLRYSCMSAYCIYVKELAERCGMEYFCADGKVAFFGMYVFD